MKKILSVLLIAAMLAAGFSFCASGADTWSATGVSYLDAKQSFYKNPGRGAANTMDSQFWVTCNDKGTTYVAKESDFTKYGIYTPLFELNAFSAGNDHVYEGIPNASQDPSVVGGVDKPINDQTLEAIEAAFKNAQINGVVCIPRFAYDKDGIAGKEPADIKTILGHIKQISKILNKYTGTVIAIECGIIGPYGEMWGSKYVPKEQANQILDAWLSNLDSSINVLVRNPSYILNYLNTNAVKFKESLPLDEESPAYRLGLYNDGYMGTDTDWGTFLAPNAMEFTNLTRKSAIAFMKDQNRRMPYGGEYAHPESIEYIKQHGSPLFTDGYVEELYDTHYAYSRNVDSAGHIIMAYEKTMPFTNQYAFEGMPNVSEYYTENLWKFVFDHMGYRFVVRNSETTTVADQGGIVKFRGSVENTGFGNVLFQPVSEIVLVDPEGEIITTEAYVDVKEWESAQTTDYAVTLSVPTDAKEGEYKVYLRVGTSSYKDAKTPSTGTIRFANAEIYNEEVGGNYLGTMTVSDKKGGYASEFAQINTGKFSDVAETAWYADPIYYAVSNKLMSGMSATTFQPETTTSRGMLVQVLYNLEGRPALKGTSPFTDLKQDWYKEAVHWAYGEKIVAGLTKTEFGPEEELTREQFAAIMYRYAEYKGMDISKQADMSKYDDFDKASEYAKPALKWANASGYITGLSATVISPRGSATRAQMASILMRFTKDAVNLEA